MNAKEFVDGLELEPGEGECLLEVLEALEGVGALVECPVCEDLGCEFCPSVRS